MKKQSISVFFPCYNDQYTIGKLIKETDNLLQRLRYNYEIIVVDDGSIDESREILTKLRNKFAKLKLIFHKKNKGYGGALRSGFAKARYDLIFYTDGDGQYSVKELKLLLQLMTEDIDVVNGIKMERNDPFMRIVVGKAYNFFVRNIFGIKIFDVDCDFRLIKRELLERVVLTSLSGAICVELVKKLQNKGARFREVTVHHYDRKFGNSQFFRPLHLFKTAIELVKLWMLFTFEKI